MSERRREERNTCYLKAELILHEAMPPVNAEVIDISEHGLRLKLPDADVVPNEFIVSVPRRHIRELVRVRRRTKTTLGVIITRFMTKVA